MTSRDVSDSGLLWLPQDLESSQLLCDLRQASAITLFNHHTPCEAPAGVEQLIGAVLMAEQIGLVDTVHALANCVYVRAATLLVARYGNQTVPVSCSNKRCGRRGGGH